MIKIMVRTIEDKHPEYFEAILQLRNVSKEIEDYVKEQIKKNKIHLAKIQKVKNGSDFYLSDNSFTRGLGKKLQQKFDGQFMLTTSLVGKKKNKDLHRFTVLFRGINFKKGEEIEYQGDKYIVKGLGKQIMLKDSKTGKKVNVNWKDIKDIRV